MKKSRVDIDIQVAYLELHRDSVSVQIVLLGTKEDLRGDEAALAALRSASGPEAAPVSEGEATEVARRIRAHSYCLTSAKTGQGVTEAFNAAITAAEASPDGANPTCCILL